MTKRFNIVAALVKTNCWVVVKPLRYLRNCVGVEAVDAKVGGKLVEPSS